MVGAARASTVDARVIEKLISAQEDPEDFAIG